MVIKALVVMSSLLKNIPPLLLHYNWTMLVGSGYFEAKEKIVPFKALTYVCLQGKEVCMCMYFYSEHINCVTYLIVTFFCNYESFAELCIKLESSILMKVLSLCYQGLLY